MITSWLQFIGWVTNYFQTYGHLGSCISPLLFHQVNRLTVNRANWNENLVLLLRIQVLNMIFASESEIHMHRKLLICTEKWLSVAGSPMKSPLISYHQFRCKARSESTHFQVWDYVFSESEFLIWYDNTDRLIRCFQFSSEKTYTAIVRKM